MEVVVEDKQLSLAIGKKGQNVRLAAKIVGWRIDIKSEEEKRQEVEAEMARMARIVEELRSLEPHGVSEKVIQKLNDSGVGGVAHLLEMTAEDLETIDGVGPKTAEAIRSAATAAKAEWDQRDAEEQARIDAENAAAAAEAALDQDQSAEGDMGEPADAETEGGEPVSELATAVETGDGRGNGGEPDGER